jgi:hypothetical protein
VQPDNVINTDPSVIKLIAAVLGSFASLKFLSGTWYERALMFIGGAALSFYAATPLAVWLNFKEGEGLIGFSVGLFGMSIADKLFEVIRDADAKAVASDLWATAKERLGVKDAAGK